VKCWASVYLGETDLLLPLAKKQVTVFPTSVWNLAFLHYNGEQALSHHQGQWGSSGSLFSLGGQISGSGRAVNCHSVEKLEFQHLDSGDWTVH
jgi:uncharacterized membrane protein YgcG